MAVENFGNCLTFVLKSEGGFVDNPMDKGGPTFQGITLETLQAFRGKPVTVQDLQMLRHDEVGDIYKTLYWDKVSGDSLYYGVDLCVFDAAVNSGPERAQEWFKGVENPFDRILRGCQARLSYLLGLNNAREEVFEKGWANRILACVQMATLMTNERMNK